MVRLAEKIMKFFRKKKSKIKSSEQKWQPPYTNAPLADNLYTRRGRIRNANQEKVIELLHKEDKNSPKRKFSNYPPLPAIGAEICEKRPTLLRQATYTVLHPVLVRGPNDLRKFNSRKTNKAVKDRKTLQNIKTKFRNESKTDLNVNKDTGSAFWFAV